MTDHEKAAEQKFQAACDAYNAAWEGLTAEYRAGTMPPKDYDRMLADLDAEHSRAVDAIFAEVP